MTNKTLNTYIKIFSKNIFFDLTKRVETAIILPSLESDVKPILGSEKGPFHRVVGLPAVFGSPGDFLFRGKQFLHASDRAYD